MLYELMAITGDGEQTRDFTNIMDAVEANMLAAEKKDIKEGEVFNIGEGRNFSINQVAKLIGGPTANIPARLEPKHTRADNSKAKKLLGWSPKISLEEGIAELKELLKLSN